MLLRYFLVMCSVLLITGCPRSFETRSPVASIPQQSLGSQQNRPIAAFTRVYVKGIFNVNLHTGYAHPQLILRGDPRDLANIKSTVVNGVLRVTEAPGRVRYGNIQMDINSRYLNSFEYHGTGTITGTKLRTGLLDLVLDNQGRTSLQGQIGLRRLDVRGKGYTEISGINSPCLLMRVSGGSTVRLAGTVNLTNLDMSKNSRLTLYWIKSKDLIIRAHGKAFIQLAGVVDKLDVELWGTARFNGRYLRAQRAFVKTHNRSVAEVSAVKRQHTLASDNSDIHFYNIPVMKADFMAVNGAVLDMRDLWPPFIQEYNQYNKPGPSRNWVT